MRRRLLLVLGALLVLFVAVATAISALFGGGNGDPDLSGFSAPRTLHLAPDGRLLVTDLGTGRNDGQVVAIDLDSGERRVLMSGLPSAHFSAPGGRVLAGPSGAAMAPDGTVCVAISGPTSAGPGFAVLRCTSGLAADLGAHELQRDYDGLGAKSDPFDVAWDGRGGWYVSDAAANTILRVTSSGTISLISIFRYFPTLPTDRQGVPAGLSVDAEGTLLIALNGGAVTYLSPAGGSNPLLSGTEVAFPIAAIRNGTDTIVLSYSDRSGAERTGAVSVGGRTVISKLDRPTGMVRLRDGRYIIAEQDRGLVRIVSPD